MALTRTSTGLVFQETFNPGSDWSNTNWSSRNEPSFVASPRSPIVTLAPTGSLAGGVRESQIFEESDGVWWHFYSAGDGTSGSGGPWRIQYSSSEDRGLSWTHHGYTDFDLQKTSNPADGYYPCRDMLYLEKRGSTYYLHAMSGGNEPTVPQHPIAPLEADLFTGPSVTGPWTFVRRTCVVTPGTYTEDYLVASCVVESGGTYYLFSTAAQPTGSYLINPDIGGALSPEGPWPHALLPWFHDKPRHAGENPKVFFSPTLGKWAMLANPYNPISLDDHAGGIHIGASLTDWSRNVKTYITQNRDHTSGMDNGKWEVGLGSPFYRAEAEAIQTADGYVPFTYDAEPVSIANYHQRICYHKIYYAVHEPSTHCMEYTPGVFGFSDNFNRSTRNINGDNGWTQPYGSFQIAIASNKLNMGSLTQDVICVQSASVANVALEASITLGAAAAVGFIARYTDANNFLLVSFASSGGFCAVDAFEKVDGNYTHLGNIATQYRWTADDTHLCRATVVGTTIACFFDGVRVGAITDSTITTSAGSVGLRNGNTSTNQRIVDDFSWRTLSGNVERSAEKTLSHAGFIAEFAVMLDATDTNAAVGLDYRIQGSGDSYRLVLKAGVGLQLQKSTGGSAGTPGSFTNLATYSGAGVPIPEVVHKIRVDVSFNTHRAYLDGEAQINYTDNSSPYTSGAALALVGAIAPSRVRNLHLRSSNDITINGLTNGDTVTLRAPGGVPIATATVSGTSHTFTYTHFPMGSIDVNGTQAYP